VVVLSCRLRLRTCSLSFNLHLHLQGGRNADRTRHELPACLFQYSHMAILDSLGCLDETEHVLALHKRACKPLKA
jgi:hypothetical protein